MNSWFDVVRNTPHLMQKFVDVVVSGEVDVTQPLSCSLALHLFGDLRTNDSALTDNVWLYTERKLAESTRLATVAAMMCACGRPAAFDEAMCSSYPAFPAVANGVPLCATGIASVVGQRLPIPYVAGLRVEEEQAKVRGTDAEWTITTS
jgi:hypothetical protein